MLRCSRAAGCAVATIVAGLCGVLPAAYAASCAKAGFKIFIDAGHTPNAPGAISARGRTELEFNLRLSALIEKRLKDMGYLRTIRHVAPAGESLAMRVAAENGENPDLLVSIHHDSVQKIFMRPWTYQVAPAFYSDHAKGWSLFVSQSNIHAEASLRLARLIADRLLAAGLRFSTHHAEQIAGENRTFIDAARGIYRRDRLEVLARSSAPAALLEAGVIVNPDEELELMSPSRQAKTAEAVAGAIDQFCKEANAQ